MDETEDLMVVGEIAKKLRLAVPTVYAKAKRGEIPGAFYIGTTLRVDREIFNKHFQEQRKNPPKRS